MVVLKYSAIRNFTKFTTLLRAPSAATDLKKLSLNIPTLPFHILVLQKRLLKFRLCHSRTTPCGRLSWYKVATGVLVATSQENFRALQSVYGVSRYGTKAGLPQIFQIFSFPQICHQSRIDDVQQILLIHTPSRFDEDQRH